MENTKETTVNINWYGEDNKWDTKDARKRKSAAPQLQSDTRGKVYEEGKNNDTNSP